MATLVKKGIKVFYGFEKLPNIPVNYRVQVSPLEAVRVHDDLHGKQYIVADDPPRLVPILERRVDGLTLRTDMRCDFENPIFLD